MKIPDDVPHIQAECSDCGFIFDMKFGTQLSGLCTYRCEVGAVSHRTRSAGLWLRGTHATTHCFGQLPQTNRDHA